MAAPVRGLGPTPVAVAQREPSQVQVSPSSWVAERPPKRTSWWRAKSQASAVSARPGGDPGLAGPAATPQVGSDSKARTGEGLGAGEGSSLGTLGADAGEQATRARRTASSSARRTDSSAPTGAAEVSSWG